MDPGSTPAKESGELIVFWDTLSGLKVFGQIFSYKIYDRAYFHVLLS